MEIGVLIRDGDGAGGCERRPRVFDCCPARIFLLSSSLTAACKGTGQGQRGRADTDRHTQRESEHPNPSHLIKPRAGRQRTDPREEPVNGQGTSKLGASTTGWISWQGGSKTLSVWSTMGWAGWMSRLLAVVLVLVLVPCRKGVDREGDVLPAVWLGWAACVCVWVIATGQERSPVHGAGPRQTRMPDARWPLPAAGPQP